MRKSENIQGGQPSERIAVRAGTIPDEVVIQRVLRGDTASFELLMRRYNQRLYRVVRSYLKEQALVEDIMQETYIKAFTKLDRFRGEASFSTWLIRIGINEALGYLRRNKVHFDSIDASRDSAPRVPLGDRGDKGPENRTIMKENQHILEEAIDRLPEKYRAVFVMREVEGLSHAEVAEALDLSEANTKVRLHRAKSVLRDELYNLTEGGEVFDFGNELCDRLVERVMQRIAG